jgi:hypothetical protein
LGTLVTHPKTTVIASGVVAVSVSLNVFVITLLFRGR